MMVEGKTEKEDKGKALPDGWHWVKLGNICDIKGGKRLPKGSNFATHTTSFPYIRVTDFENFSVSLEDLRFIEEETHNQISRYIIHKDDVFISIAGSIGIVGTIPAILDGANLTENAAKLVIGESQVISQDYLAHFLQSPTGQSQIKARTNVVGQPKLALTRIKTIEIPLPPIAEQKRIVAILSERLAAVDQARQATQAQLKAAQALPAAYLREIFDTVDTQFPNDKFCLKQVCEAIVDCEHKTAPTQEVGIPMVRTSNIRSGVIDFDNSRRVSEETYKQWTARLEPKANDLILAREAPVGEVGIIPVGQRACLGQRTVLIRVDHQKVFAKYIMYFLMNSNSKREMIRLSGGSLVPHLNMSDIRDFQIILPPLKIQKDIVEKLDAKTQDTTRLLQSLQSQLDTINALPAALLRQAFSGEL